MKLLSLPTLLIGLAVVSLGGLVYAFSGATHRSTSTATLQTSPSTTPADALGATTDPGAAPASRPADSGASDMVAQAAPAPATPNGVGQPGAAGAQRGQRMQQMMAQLGLSPEQKTQIQQIRSSTTDKQQRREEIQKVLTPDQLAKFQQLRAQMRAQHGQ